MSRVKHIRVRNVLGIADLEVEPGNVTLIEGGNGRGKTSFVEALLTLVGSGYDATLVREGADQAEVVIVLDDETKISKRIRKNGGGDTKVSHPDFGNVGAPQSFLSGITDALSYNPVAFLTAKDRTRALLEALPMSIQKADIDAAVAGTSLQLFEHGIGTKHALEVIDGVRKQVYDERTAVNRTVRDKQKTAEGLRAAVPDDFTDAGEIERQLKDARGAQRDAEAELQRKLGAVDAEIERELASGLERLRSAQGAVRQAAKDEAQPVIDAVNEKRAQVEALRLEIVSLMENVTVIEHKAELAIAELPTEQEISTGVRADAQPRKEAVVVAERPRVNELAQAVTRFEEQLRTAGSHATARKIMEDAQAEADQAKEQSDALSAALERLDGLKDRLSAQIPIDGVTVQDGEVYVDGHPFARVNRARQVRVAVELARIRAGKLPLVCVDGLECLEREAFDAFVTELQQADLQAFVTRVTEGPLQVRSLDPVEV
jgi:energy-coupling factor transporter ATP-binding protein EcfA2